MILYNLDICDFNVAMVIKFKYIIKVIYYPLFRYKFYPMKYYA